MLQGKKTLTEEEKIVDSYYNRIKSLLGALQANQSVTSHKAASEELSSRLRYVFTKFLSPKTGLDYILYRRIHGLELLHQIVLQELEPCE